jgi:Uma2 family endonuclease
MVRSVLATARPHLSFEEYCQIESRSPIKHEYVDGQALAMAGGSREHAALCANILGLLTAQLRGRRCQAHTSDLRVRVRATGLATYPDVTVICGRAELDPEDRLGHTALNPTLLVEVLSPSTEEYDRGEKLTHYKQIEALREVVLVTQRERSVEVWRREGDRRPWVRAEHREGLVPLKSIEAEISIDDLYRDPLASP